MCKLKFLFFCTFFYGIQYFLLYSEPNLDTAFKDFKEKNERRTLDPIELDIKLLKKRLEIWNALEERISSLVDELKKIYDPISSPFFKKKTLSESLHFKVKNISKTPLEGEKKIEILTIAKADRIQSRSFLADEKLMPANFSLKINNKEFIFNFPGGTLHDLFLLLQKEQNQRYYYAYFLPLDYLKNKNILVLEGSETGLDHKLVFLGDLNFLQYLGFLKTAASVDKNPTQFHDSEKTNLSKEKDLDKETKQKEIKHIDLLFENFSNNNNNSSSKEIQILDKKLIKTEIFQDEERANFRKLSYLEFFIKNEKKDGDKSLEAHEKNERESNQYLLENKDKVDLDIGKVDVLKIEDFDFKTKSLTKYFDPEKKNQFYKKEDLIKLDELNATDPQQDNKSVKKNSLSLKVNFLDKLGNKFLQEPLEWDLEFPAEESTEKKQDFQTEKNNWIKLKYEIPESIHLNVSEIYQVSFFSDSNLESTPLKQPDIKWFLKDLKIAVLKETPSLKQDLKFDGLASKTSEKIDRSYNFIQEAQNAEFLIDGVKFERAFNIINDVLPGISLELKSKNQHEESIVIEKDYQLIYDFIDNLVVTYNSFYIFLSNILDSPKDQEEMRFFLMIKSDLKKWQEKEDEFNKKSSEEKKYDIHVGEAYRGYMNYEYMLKNLKERLLTMIFSTTYGGEENQNIRFLIQIGIHSYDFLDDKQSLYRDLHLRKGLLKINEDQFMKMLKEHFYEIQSFFAYKDKESAIKNKGLAVELIEFLNNYIKGTKKDKYYYDSFIDVKRNELKKAIRMKELSYEKESERLDQKLGKFKNDIEKAKQYKEYYENKKDYFRNTYGAMNSK